LKLAAASMHRDWSAAGKRNLLDEFIPRFVLEAQGISADESALALVAAKGLGTSRLAMLQPRPYGDSPRRTR